MQNPFGQKKTSNMTKFMPSFLLKKKRYPRWLYFIILFFLRGIFLILVFSTSFWFSAKYYEQKYKQENMNDLLMRLNNPNFKLAEAIRAKANFTCKELEQLKQPFHFFPLKKDRLLRVVTWDKNKHLLLETFFSDDGQMWFFQEENLCQAPS
jgi:hypothetical protein